ncbi:MAG: tRNA pseudouridine(38-40) synthase TruA [Bacteroidota bacterium]
MRYFAELAYNGTPFFGWQKQPNQPSVQGCIEEALSLLLRESINIVGCGRTDTRVHARQYFIHFDVSQPLHEKFLVRLNKYLPPEIAFRRFMPVLDDAHARYHANYRSYTYYITKQKNPFAEQTRYLFPFIHQLDTDKMVEATHLLMAHTAFFPFCKTNNDLKSYDCQLYRCEWDFQENEYHLHIAANRFLRGMVRLVVGMCLNVGLGKVSLQEVQQALKEQSRLDMSWSVPPQGLFLEEIRYDKAKIAIR